MPCRGDGWPDDLTELPGVGPYTSAAVRCFAFGEDVLPVDVNVERVQRRTRVDFDVGRRPGPDGPRRDGLPRSDPSLRDVPARQPAARRAAFATSPRGSKVRSTAPFDNDARDSAARRCTQPRELDALDDEAVRSLERDGLVVIADGPVALPG